jgi:hypothetical protein
MQHLRGKGDSRHHWMFDVNMDTGKMARPYVSSLQSFWPAMQV